MNVDVQYKTSDDKDDWFANHVLTKEQFAQLVRNKIERAKVYQKDAREVFALTEYD